MSRSKLEFIASFTRMMRFSSLRIYKTCLRLTIKVFLHLLRNITKNYFITTREPIKYKYMLLMVLFSESCYLNRFVCIYIYIYIYIYIQNLLNYTFSFLIEKYTFWQENKRYIFNIYFQCCNVFQNGFLYTHLWFSHHKGLYIFHVYF